MSSRMHLALILAAVVVAPGAAAPHDSVPSSFGGSGSLAEVQRSIEFFDQRVADQPSDALAWSKLAALRLELARTTSAHEVFADAYAAFERLTELQPANAAGYLGMAYADLGRHAFARGFAHARAAARCAPDSPEVRALLGDLHFAVGNYTEAEMAFESLTDGDLTLHALARLGMLHQARGRWDAARTAFERAAEVGRLLEAPPADLGWCAAMQGDLAYALGDVATARTHYVAALELSPAEKLGAHGLARVLRAEGHAHEALPMLERLAETAPEPVQWIALAELARSLGQADAAQTWHARARADMVADWKAGEEGHLRELADHLLAGGEDPALALELAQANLAARRDPESVATTAAAHHALGNTTEAVTLIEEALSWGGATRPTLTRARDIYRSANKAAELTLIEARLADLALVVPAHH